MKIACLTASVSRKAGGLHDGVRRLCQSLNSQPGTEVHVLGLIDEYTRDDAPGWAPLPMHVFSVLGPRNFGYAPRLKERLFELDADIVLTHGLWMYPTVVALEWHRRTQRPFVISPQGMLDPWAINNSHWKKRIAGFFYENAGLQNAACLRAVCPSEAQSIRAYGLPNPICVIPNGMAPTGESIALSPPWKGKVAAGRNTLLYLGRIHPKKGLANLMRAWAITRQRFSTSIRNWDLVVAGWSQNSHEQELKTLARQLGITASVHFPGPQFGEAKMAAHHHADAFILPSFSEGLPMAVLEAWAQHLPVIMTPQCHLPEGFEAGAAIRAQPETASIVEALETLFLMDPTERRKMGHNGHQLVAEHFNWSEIGAQMHDVCRWLVEGSDPPGCVLNDKRKIVVHEPSLA
jgi:glycosyltransferase involved in cell wall biosynthesis